MVIWFIGISGAGKTTLGGKLKDYYDGKGIKSFILDGDLVRDFYDNDLGYSKSDRIQNIKRIMLSAYILEQNGIIPIVCNISPFEFLRSFAKTKFQDYHEIYLKKDINIAKDNDIKKIYIENINKTDIVGLDMKFEKPKNSNLTIEVDKENPQLSFEKVKKYLNIKI